MLTFSIQSQIFAHCRILERVDLRRGRWRRPRMAELCRSLRPEEEQMVPDRKFEDQEMEVRTGGPRGVPLCPRRHGLATSRFLGFPTQQCRALLAR